MILLLHPDVLTQEYLIK